MFDKATRLKLRFDTSRGCLGVEDLWDLPLTGRFSLDEVAIGLHRQIRETADMTSFVTPRPEPDENLLQLRFDIVKSIIDVKVKERDEAKLAFDKAQKKQQLLEVLARKQNAELENKTPQEIEAMINAL